MKESNMLCGRGLHIFSYDDKHNQIVVIVTVSPILAVSRNCSNRDINLDYMWQCSLNTVNANIRE